jgi:hypothetical protein
MDEQLVGGLVCVVTAIPLVILGLRYRAGRNLETIAGYRPEVIRDKDGFGRFMGFWMLVIAALVIALGAGIALVPERHAQWLALGIVAALQVPILRMTLGTSKFKRK